MCVIEDSADCDLYSVNVSYVLFHAPSGGVVMLFERCQHTCADYPLLAELLVLSHRGEVLVKKTYSPPSNLAAIDVVVASVVDPSGYEPLFRRQGINFACVQQGEVVIATYGFSDHSSPCVVTEFLSSLGSVLASFLGGLSEAHLRRNTTLVYEVLDEVVDCGIIQTTSVEQLKTLVHEVAATTETDTPNAWKTLQNKFDCKAGASAVPRAVAAKGGGSAEIFVDVHEVLSVAHDGEATATGHVKVRSFLPGNPIVSVGLNNTIKVRGGMAGAAEGPSDVHDAGGLLLDHCSFNSLVRSADWDAFRVLRFTPSEGQMTAFSYSTTTRVKRPFHVVVSVEQTSPYIHELAVRIRADISVNAKATNLIAELDVPSTVVKASFSYGLGRCRDAVGNEAEYRSQENKILWGLDKMLGQTESVLFVSLSHDKVIQDHAAMRSTAITLHFEVENWAATDVAIQFVKVDAGSNYYSPEKWVRYLCTSESYHQRL
jgi:AP-2 complex subunit mu-1